MGVVYSSKVASPVEGKLFFENKLDASDSLNVLYNEYIASDYFYRVYAQSLMPIARENLSPQSLYLLLQTCREYTDSTSVFDGKDPAYITAQSQFTRTLEIWKQKNQWVNGLIISGGYVAFLKRHYPHQAVRLNKILSQEQTVQTSIPKQEMIPQAPVTLPSTPQHHNKYQ
jgi:hypothetical protein